MTRKNFKPRKGHAAQPPVGGEAKADGKLEIARAFLQGASLAGNAIASLKMTGDQTDMEALSRALIEQCQRVIDGELNRPGTLLICQAQTLDALFNRELMAATKQNALLQFQAHMKVALRAQSQCRATLETLAAIKNPAPVAFVRQANIAHGPQQVNNGPSVAAELSHAREIQNVQNRILEHAHGERLDTLTACAAGDADPAVAALGKDNGTKDRRG